MINFHADGNKQSGHCVCLLVNTINNDSEVEETQISQLDAHYKLNVPNPALAYTHIAHLSQVKRGKTHSSSTSLPNLEYSQQEQSTSPGTAALLRWSLCPTAEGRLSSQGLPQPRPIPTLTEKNTRNWTQEIAPFPRKGQHPPASGLPLAGLTEPNGASNPHHQ